MNFDNFLAQAKEKEKSVSISFTDDWRWKQLEKLNCAYYVQNQLIKLEKIFNEYLSLKDGIDRLEYEVDFYHFESEQFKKIQFELAQNIWETTLSKTIRGTVEQLNEWLALSVYLESTDWDYMDFIGEDGIIPFLSAYFKVGNIRNAEDAGYNKFKKEIYDLLKIDHHGIYNYVEIKKDKLRRIELVRYDEWYSGEVDSHEKLAWNYETKVNKLLLALFSFDRDHHVRSEILSFFYGDDQQRYVPIVRFDMKGHMEKIKSVRFYKNGNVDVKFRNEQTLHEFLVWIREH